MKNRIFTLILVSTGLIINAQNTFPSSGNVGIGTVSPSKSLEINGDILLRNSTGLKQIFTWNPTDTNWRIGMNDNPGFTRSMLTRHVQYLTYAAGTRQGFAIGVNGGDSSLEVRGSDHATFFRGNVGIGTPNPSKKLDINGDILLRNSTGLKQIFTWNPTDTNWRIGMNENPGFTRAMLTRHVQYLTYAAGTTQGFAIGVNGGDSSFEVRGSDHEAFFRGNIGVGTTDTGSHRLAVEGSIGSREVVVQTGSWSDFVFEKDYYLPSLEEVENHIREHGHLSDIPSEKEVIKNGINLGEMDAKLLQKIEELTLYVIQQDKRIRTLESQLKEK